MSNYPTKNIELAAKDEEIQQLKARIAFMASNDYVHSLTAEIERLRQRNALLESLLGECIRHKYYDENACSPSWLKEARKATEKER